MLRVTNTECGMVRGFPGTDARVTVFKGIPYAAPTSGENRWRAPQPAACWDGVRDCYEFAPVSMQRTPGRDRDAFYSREWHVDPDVAMGEDSLALNIWTPMNTGDENLPVFVWYHGGGLQDGYAYEMEFDGERFAKRGIVIVTIAYRLNCFGFLCHPEITAEAPDAPANFGLLDQKAGLEWVRRNIANFGGDPDNITIGGQSAGAASVLAHMSTPASNSLFKKAVIQSIGGVTPVYPPAPIMRTRTLEQAEKDGVDFFENKLGVHSLAEARALDAKYVEEQYLEYNTELHGAWNALGWGMVIDNKFLFENSSDCMLKNEMPRIPMIIGATSADLIKVGPEEGTVQEIKDWVYSNFGAHSQELLVAAEELCGEDPQEMKKALSFISMELNEQLFCETAAAQGRTCYGYHFAPEMPGDDAGAFHSSCLWFTFETLAKCWRPFKGKHYDLARQMCNYWSNFIKTGDPNGNDTDGVPMPKWMPYTKESPYQMCFGDTAGMEYRRPDKIRQLLIDINKKALGIER